MELWRDPPEIDFLLHLPSKNEFIPCDFSVRAYSTCNGPVNELTPRCILNEPLMKFWYKLDRTFKLPRANTYFRINLKGGYDNVKSCLLTELFIHLLKDEMNEIIYQVIHLSLKNNDSLVLTDDWFVCVRFVPWKNCTHFVRLWSICCETCGYCRADYSSGSLHGLWNAIGNYPKMSFLDWNILDLFSRVMFLFAVFFVFIGSMIFFWKKMLYHLMVLVAPVILCFISKSYYIVPFFESLDGIGYLSSIEVFFFLFN